MNYVVDVIPHVSCWSRMKRTICPEPHIHRNRMYMIFFAKKATPLHLGRRASNLQRTDRLIFSLICWKVSLCWCEVDPFVNKHWWRSVRSFGLCSFVRDILFPCGSRRSSWIVFWALLACLTKSEQSQRLYSNLTWFSLSSFFALSYL